MPMPVFPRRRREVEYTPGTRLPHKRYDNGKSVDIMAIITETRNMELTKDLNMRQETGLKCLVTPAYE